MVNVFGINRKVGMISRNIGAYGGSGLIGLIGLICMTLTAITGICLEFLSRLWFSFTPGSFIPFLLSGVKCFGTPGGP